MKWKWRIATEEKDVWRNFLNYRYVNPSAKMFVNDRKAISNNDSIWWRDLLLHNDCEDSYGLSFSDLVSCRLNKGDAIYFWFSI